MNSEKIHILFIHTGNPEYLFYVLKQARNTNPKAEIDLIGDEQNNKYDFINHYFIKDYFTEASEFGKIYKHLSTNKYEFELICFQRWFVIKEFVLRNNINKFICLDSDVMLFSDIQNEFAKFSDYEFTLSGGHSAGTSFWNSQDALVKFCNYMSNIYSKKDPFGYQNLMGFAEEYKMSGKPGGVCDMTLFISYYLLHPQSIGDTTKIINQSTYDDNFASSLNGDYEFEMQRGVKKIFWNNGKPYGLLKNDHGNPVLFNCLHCYGGTKTHIKRIYLQKKIKISINFLLKRSGAYKILHKIKTWGKQLIKNNSTVF